MSAEEARHLVGLKYHYCVFFTQGLSKWKKSLHIFCLNAGGCLSKWEYPGNMMWLVTKSSGVLCIYCFHPLQLVQDFVHQQ